MEQAERVQALAGLRKLERDLEAASGWLDDRGEQRAAVLVEDAWRSVLAAQALIDRDPGRVLSVLHHARVLDVPETATPDA